MYVYLFNYITNIHNILCYFNIYIQSTNNKATELNICICIERDNDIFYANLALNSVNVLPFCVWIPYSHFC